MRYLRIGDLAETLFNPLALAASALRYRWHAQLLESQRVGRDSRGYAAKKINGRKRHITVDTLGLPVMVTVTAADVQDRDAVHAGEGEQR